MRFSAWQNLTPFLLGFLLGGALIFVLKGAKAVPSPRPAVHVVAKRKPRPVNLRPSWSQQPLLVTPSIDANVSYLNSLDLIPETDLNASLLSANKSRELRQEFESLERSYELRRHAGLTTLDEDAAQYALRAQLANKVKNEVRIQQVRKGTRRARTWVMNEIPRSLQVAAAVAAVSTGQPIEQSLSEDTHLVASANVPYMSSYVQMTSPMVNTTLSVAGTPTSSAKLLGQPRPDWFQNSERVYLTMNRPLPVWDLGAGVAYGGTSSTVSTSLSKQLAPNLDAAVSHRMPVEDTSSLLVPEDTFQIQYKLTF